MSPERSREIYLREEPLNEINSVEFILKKSEEIELSSDFLEKIINFNNFNKDKNLEINKIKIEPFLKDYINSSFNKNTFSFPQTTYLPKKTQDFSIDVPHVPQSIDFGYVYLTNPREREALLKEVLRVMSEMDTQSVNAAVFCDRGARPIATLMAQLWPAFSDKPMPKFFFVNTDPKRTYNFEAEAVPQSDIEDLNAWLLNEYSDEENPFRNGNARVCVIDENKSTGKSAAFVQGVVNRALGDKTEYIYCDWANVGGSSLSWRNNGTMIGAETQKGKFKSIPVSSKQADMLQEDLVRMAEEYASRATTIA